MIHSKNCKESLKTILSELDASNDPQAIADLSTILEKLVAIGKYKVNAVSYHKSGLPAYAIQQEEQINNLVSSLPPEINQWYNQQVL